MGDALDGTFLGKPPLEAGDGAFLGEALEGGLERGMVFQVMPHG